MQTGKREGRRINKISIYCPSYDKPHIWSRLPLFRGTDNVQVQQSGQGCSKPSIPCFQSWNLPIEKSRRFDELKIGLETRLITQP